MDLELVIWKGLHDSFCDHGAISLLAVTVGFNFCYSLYYFKHYSAVFSIRDNWDLICQTKLEVLLFVLNLHLVLNECST